MKQNESNSLHYLLVTSFSFFIGVPMIIKGSGSFSILSLILGGFIGLFLISIVRAIFAKKSSYLENWSSYKLLKTSAFIFIIPLIIISLTLALNFTQTLLSDRTPALMILGPLIILVIYISNKNSIIIMRLALIFGFLNIIIHFAFLCLLIPNLNFNYLFSTDNFNVLSILSSGLKMGIIFFLPSWMLSLFQIRIKTSIKSFFISYLIIILITILTLSSLGLTLASFSNYPVIFAIKNFKLLNYLLILTWLTNLIAVLIVSVNILKASLSSFKWLLELIMMILVLLVCYFYPSSLLLLIVSFSAFISFMLIIMFKKNK